LSAVDPTAPTGTVPEENQDRFAGLIVLRTTGDPAHSIIDFRAAVASVDPTCLSPKSPPSAKR